MVLLPAEQNAGQSMLPRFNSIGEHLVAVRGEIHTPHGVALDEERIPGPGRLLPPISTLATTRTSWYPWYGAAL